MNALVVAILLVAQDPAPKPYTPDWKPTAAELIALIDKETREPQLRYLLGRAKTLGKEGARVFEHALASDSAWLRGEAIEGVTALGADAVALLPEFVKRLSANQARCVSLRPNPEVERARKRASGLVTIDGKREGENAEVEGRALADAVAAIGKSDPKALEALLAPAAPASIDRGWSMLHLAFAGASRANAEVVADLFRARWKDAPIAERVLLVAGCAQVDWEPGPVVDQLVAALSDKSADLRQAACLVLAQQPRLDARTFAEPLRKLLTEASPGVRLTAATVLARSGESDGLREILRSLSGPDDGIVIAACALLAQIATGDPKKDPPWPPLPANTVETLVQVANSERSMFVRLAVIDVLAALADRSPDALQTLKTLAAKDDLVGGKARAAVERLAGKRPK